MAIFKLLYKYMKMISLQNVMGKIINDIITLFLFNILKLLCSYFCAFNLFSYLNVCIEWFGESHLRATVYKFTRTRQIIRYRATATLRRPQNKQYSASKLGEVLQNQQEHYIILTKYEAVHPTAVSENNSSSGMLII